MISIFMVWTKVMVTMVNIKVMISIFIVWTKSWLVFSWFRQKSWLVFHGFAKVMVISFLWFGQSHD